MRLFHSYRHRPKRYKSLYERAWHYHDRHPLPAPLNKTAREVLYVGRRLRHALRTRGDASHDAFGDPVVPADRALDPVRPFTAPPLDAVEAKFRELHVMNEHLYNGDGSWAPHPNMALYGSGVPIEEVSERILGYLFAHDAFGTEVYLDRARTAGEYLLERRVFADGHLRLEGHLVIELVYTFAGRALLELSSRPPSDDRYLQAAILIADRLLEEHRGGALDHAAIPAQLFGPLYRVTGRKEYLEAALDRVLRTVAFQLPYGGWAGTDARIWYHSIISRSVIETYVSTPNTLAYYVKKDRLARSITAALNRVLAAQSPGGELKIGRGDGSKDPLFAEYKERFGKIASRFTGDGFERARLPLEDYTGRDEMDFLTAAFDELSIQPAAVAAHGYARAALRGDVVNRLEFETYALGRYASFLTRASRLNPETQRRIGVAS